MSSVWISRESWDRVWSAIHNIRVRMDPRVKTPSTCITGQGTSSRINIELPAGLDGDDYDGPFAVRYDAEKKVLAINPGWRNAGGVWSAVPAAELSPETSGKLCLHCDPAVDYQDDTAPDFRITEPGALDFPIAEITLAEDGESVQIRQYYSQVAVYLTGSGAASRGMFHIIPVFPADAAADPSVPVLSTGYRCVDSTAPDNGKAGIASINQQSWELPAINIPVPSSDLYVYVHFVLPIDTDNPTRKPGDASAELVAVDKVHGSNSPRDLWYLVGIIYATPGDALHPCRVNQVHRPGPVSCDWWGPCFHLLQDPGNPYPATETMNRE